MVEIFIFPMKMAINWAVDILHFRIAIVGGLPGQPQILCARSRPAQLTPRVCCACGRQANILKPNPNKSIFLNLKIAANLYIIYIIIYIYIF